MKLENVIENYDAIVIGSGHAGSEAALSLARLGKKTLLTTVVFVCLVRFVCLSSVPLTPCNRFHAAGYLFYGASKHGTLFGIVSTLSLKKSPHISLHEASGSTCRSSKTAFKTILLRQLIRRILLRQFF